MQVLREICRICTSESTVLRSIYESSDLNMKYKDILSSLFRDLNILPEENLQTVFLCNKCCDQALNAYEFKQICLKSVSFWENQLEKQSTQLQNLKVYGVINLQVENTTTSNEVQNVEATVAISIKDKSGEMKKSENNAEEKCSPFVLPRPKKAAKSEKFPSSIDPSTYILDKTQNFFFCNTCEKNFAKRDSLKTHMLKHTGVKPFSCTFCEKKSFTYSELKKHVLTHSKDYPFSCTNCKKSFKTEKRLKAHALNHQKSRQYMCHICGKSFALNCNLKNHLLTHAQEKTFTCSICREKFKAASSLKSHVDKHNRRTFHCGPCKKFFQTHSGFYVHKLKKHGGEKRFQCHLCNKGFFLKSQVTQHLKRHANEAKAVCSVCGRAFSTNSVLRDHMRVHTGEKPYQCHVCEKAFAQSGTLLVHMRLHTGNRPYKCKICGKGFIKSHHYQNHVKTHHGSL